jgi:hypothetical protein
MHDLVLHPATKSQLEALTAEPQHAVLLTAPKGAGKATVVRWFAEQLIGSDVAEHPYVAYVNRGKEKSISIESVRSLEHFLSLRVPANDAVNRIVIIDDAHLLTHEAQNALLKTLEEPPLGTVLLLTAANEQALLPTVRSRVATVSIRAPRSTEIIEYFVASGKQSMAVEQAATISGGLPGLMTALLEDSDHELVPAIAKARELLSLTQYGRLVEVDSLTKDRELADNTLFILQQMAEVQLRRPGATNVDRWSRVLQASFDAERQLAQSGQAKLVLSNLMLNLG